MQINKNYETEIDLRDLFFHLCYRWRSILIAALIGAIALATFQYLSIQRIHAEGKQTKEEKQFEIDLQDYQDSVKNTKSNIRTYNKLIKEKNDYLDESIYMSLDSQNEWVANKRYFIKMAQSVMDALPDSLQEDPADYVASVYMATLKSGLDVDEMEQLLGTGKKEYIDELVGVWADNAANTITIQVIGPNEETVNKQMDYFSNRMVEVSQPQAQTVAEHTLHLVNEDCLSRTDTGLSEMQDQINKQILNWQTALKEQREMLNELEEDGEPTAPGKHLVRFAVIGFLLGALLLAGIQLAKYTFAAKLHSGDELMERYGLPVFGEYTKSRARHPGKGLDKLFERWEFNHAITDAEATTDSVCALLGERFAGKKLLLTGTVPAERLNAYIDCLHKKLDGTCEIVTAGGLPMNADAIVDVKDFDAVILVEEKHISRNGDILRAVEMLQIGGADVKGCIVI